MGLEMSFYKRPKVFGEKCLSHGIGPSGNTAVNLADALKPRTSAIDRKRMVA